MYIYICIYIYIYIYCLYIQYYYMYTHNTQTYATQATGVTDMIRLANAHSTAALNLPPFMSMSGVNSSSLISKRKSIIFSNTSAGTPI